jgi:two-component system, OmpR family, KDP operon response regulator KdpE
VTVLLVVGPSSATRRVIATALRHDGHEVKLVRGPDHAGDLVRRTQVGGLVLVDASPPSADWLADLRTRTDAPILVVSERAESIERAAGLDAGADEYLTYPCDIEEFLARVRAVLRRFERAADDTPYQTDDFTIYLSDRRFVRADGIEVTLSPTEWKVIEVLLRRPGHLVAHDDLLKSVWGAAVPAKSSLLRVHLSSIRRKIEPVPSEPRYIVTAPGLGITFAPALDEARGSAS